MSLIKKLSAGAILCAACVATVAQAAPVLTIVPVYDTTYDPDFNELGQLDLTNPANGGADKWHKIDIRFQLDGIGAADDFANLAFNLNLGAGLVPVDIGLSTFYNPTTVTYKVGPNDVPYYVNNADAATPMDLKGIFVNTDAAKARNRKHGETGRPVDAAGIPTILGSVYVTWDGKASIFNASPAPGTFVSIFPNNTAGAPNPVGLADAQFVTGELVFGGSVVEPPSFVAVVNSTPVAGAQAINFTGNLLYQPPVEIAGGPKDVFDVNFVSAGPIEGDLYVMYWLNGTPEDIAALKAEFEAEATGGTLLADGQMYADLMRAYPTASMILQYPGMAGILDGGSLSVDFSNTGVQVSAIAAVPEPASLLSLGALGVLGMLRRRR